jgi:hypothetical protein
LKGMKVYMVRKRLLNRLSKGLLAWLGDALVKLLNEGFSPDSPNHCLISMVSGSWSMSDLVI